MPARAQRDQLAQQHAEPILARRAFVPVRDAAVDPHDSVRRRFAALDKPGGVVGEAHRRAATAPRQSEADGQRVAATRPGRPGDAVANGSFDVAGVKRVVANRDARAAGNQVDSAQLVSGRAEPVAPRKDAAGEDGGGDGAAPRRRRPKAAPRDAGIPRPDVERPSHRVPALVHAAHRTPCAGGVGPGPRSARCPEWRTIEREPPTATPGRRRDEPERGTSEHCRDARVGGGRRSGRRPRVRPAVARSFLQR